MFFRRIYALSKLYSIPKLKHCFKKRNFSNAFNASDELVSFCATTFDLPTHKVQSVMLKWPKLQRIEEKQIIAALNSLSSVGIKKNDVLVNPTILNMNHKVIKNRANALIEIGMSDLSLHTLSRFVTLSKFKTIKELKNEGLLSQDVDVWKKLKDSVYIWPDIQSKLSDSTFDENVSLNNIRMQILYECLKLKYNIPQDMFDKMMKRYTQIKYKPLKTICLSLDKIENVLNIPKERIINNGTLLLADPDNIENIITEVKELGGLDIKIVLNKHPTLLKQNPMKLLQIKETLMNENISEESQRKCLEVYSLSPKTVIERLEELKKNKQFHGLIKNPRVLFLILYKNKATLRLTHLNNTSQRSFSLHKILSYEKEFHRFAESFSVKVKGSDIIIALNKFFSTSIPKEELRNRLKIHPFWVYVPLYNLLQTVEFLMEKFTSEEIFDNLPIILYPLVDIQHVIGQLERMKMKNYSLSNDDIKILNDSDNEVNFNISQLSNRQILSLSLYLIERNHYFTGNGIWSKKIMKPN